MRLIITTLLTLTLCSCAMIPKTKNAKKRFAVTLGGIGAGAAIGAVTVPEDE